MQPLVSEPAMMVKQRMADKKKLIAKFAEQQSIIEDRRRTSDELINNALLGCHDSNNKTPEEQCFIYQYYCRLYYTDKFQGTVDSYSNISVVSYIGFSTQSLP